MLGNLGRGFGPFDTQGVLHPFYDGTVDGRRTGGGGAGGGGAGGCPPGLVEEYPGGPCVPPPPPTPKRKILSVPTTCPPGTVEGGGGRCIPQAEYDCFKAGGTWNAATGQCVMPGDPGGGGDGSGDGGGGNGDGGGRVRHPGPIQPRPFTREPPSPRRLELPRFRDPGVLHRYFEPNDINWMGYDEFVRPTAADMLEDPGYEFRRDEGLSAIVNSQAARGMALGGAALKGLARYNSGLASQEYGQLFARRLAEHGVGRQRALDYFGADLQTDAVDFRNFMQRYGSDVDARNRALQTHLVNTGQAKDVHLINTGQQADHWNRYFQMHQANEQNRLAAHGSNIYGFSAYMDPLLRLYAIQRGGIPGYNPGPMPPPL